MTYDQACAEYWQTYHWAAAEIDRCKRAAYLEYLTGSCRPSTLDILTARLRAAEVALASARAKMLELSGSARAAPPSMW